MLLKTTSIPRARVDHKFQDQGRKHTFCIYKTTVLTQMLQTTQVSQPRPDIQKVLRELIGRPRGTSKTSKKCSSQIVAVVLHVKGL